MADQRKFLILCGLGVLFVAALLWPACARAQFVKGDEEAKLRAMIPLEKFRDDPRLLIYTERTIPRTYQLSHNGHTQAHSVAYNISGDPPDNNLPHGKGGNPGVEFPWKHTAGTDNCPTVKSFKFIRLPEGKPIVWNHERINERFFGRSPMAYVWRFPVGAIVGEVITQRSPKGYDFTFEVRTRERLKDSWTMDIFRPFPTAADLVAAIKSGRPQWEKEPQLVTLINHLESPLELPTQRLVDSKHRSKIAINAVASVDKLPPIDEDLAAALLESTPFKSALGEVWRNHNCFAPTTDARFHVIPTNYQATFAGTDDASCMKCHETTLTSAREFDRQRGWYGFTAGSDAIISFHPFLRSSINQSGGNRQAQIHNISGVIEKYDPSRHTEGYYALSK